MLAICRNPLQNQINSFFFMHHNKSTRRIYADNHMIRTLIAGLIGLLVGLTLMFIIYPFIFSP